MTLEELTQGKVKRHKGGKFLFVEKRLEDLPSQPIRDYVLKNRTRLFDDSLASKFPELRNVPRERMLFWDTENCGLGNHDCVFLIGTAQLIGKREIVLRSFFARDYSEEKAIITFFLDMAKNFQAFFTYRGKYFDLPRLKERVINNGLQEDYKNKLTHLTKNHVDLYPLARKTFSLPDGELSTLEESILHYVRVEDLSGSEIPQAYFEYVYGRERVERYQMTNNHLYNLCRKEAKNHLLTMDALLKEDDPRITLLAKDFYDRGRGRYKTSFKPGKQIDLQEAERNMQRAIYHNFDDNIATPALLIKLCS